MKTIICPASNYLLVTQVDIKEFDILRGDITKEKDVVGKVGYIDAMGPHSDVPSGTRLVIFNAKLGTHIKENSEYCYLIHKSSILGYISTADIVIQKYDEDMDVYQLKVDDRSFGMSLEKAIEKFGKKLDTTNPEG